jgi:hypothetical protein
MLTTLTDVTTLSGSGGSKDATSAPRSGISHATHSKNRASRSDRGAWVPYGSGKSKAFVETGTSNRDSDAASDNSERAIVVKRTVDVSGDSSEEKF